MTTQLELYNLALGHLGPVRLHPTTGLTENRQDRRELDAVWASTLKTMLERAVWRFAIRTSLFTADPDITPDFGLPHAYGLPNDFVRLYLISPDERQEEEDRSYRREGSVIYSDHSTLYISYVSNDPAYGYDLGKFTGLYTRAFGYALAEEACIPITKDKQLKRALSSERKDAVAEAKRLEAVDERVKEKPVGSWIRTRFGTAREARRTGRY